MNAKDVLLASVLAGGGSGGGSGGEAKVVNMTETGIDASFNELKAALLSNKNVFISLEDNDHIEIYSLSGLYHEAENLPYVSYFTGASGMAFTSNGADDPMEYEPS